MDILTDRGTIRGYLLRPLALLTADEGDEETITVVPRNCLVTVHMTDADQHDVQQADLEEAAELLKDL